MTEPVFESVTEARPLQHATRIGREVVPVEGEEHPIPDGVLELLGAAGPHARIDA